MYSVAKAERNVIERPFTKMGARVKVTLPEARPGGSTLVSPIALDVRIFLNGWH